MLRGAGDVMYTRRGMSYLWLSVCLSVCLSLSLSLSLTTLVPVSDRLSIRIRQCFGPCARQLINTVVINTAGGGGGGGSVTAQWSEASEAAGGEFASTVTQSVTSFRSLSSTVDNTSVRRKADVATAPLHWALHIARLLAR